MPCTQSPRTHLQFLPALVLLALLPLASAAPPPTAPSSAALIDILARPSLDQQIGMSTCSTDPQSRAVARSLAQLGFSALPPIEQALDEFEANPTQSGLAANIEWVLLAYAQIQGRAAVPRLRRIAAAAGLSARSALGLAFGLTSYVSGTTQPPQGRVFYCDRHADPRDALDRLIVAWMKDDRKWIEASLGPNAISAWRASPEQGTPSSSRAGLGYRFRIAGPWAEPAGSLARRSDSSTAPSPGDRPAIDTQFTDEDGAPCGNHRVTFLSVVDQYGQPAFLVDNSDLPALFSTLASCAIGRAR